MTTTRTHFTFRVAILPPRPPKPPPPRPPKPPPPPPAAGCRDGVALDLRRYDGGCQRLPSIEAYKQLPVLRAALAAHQSKYVTPTS